MANTQKLEIFFVRHGNTLNASWEDRNESDVNLSPLGEKQLFCIGERFRGRSFDAVFSSPMVRCVRTGAAICENLADHPVMEIMPELIEKGTPTGYLGQDLSYLSRYYDRLSLCPKLYGGPDQLFEKDDKQDVLNRADAVLSYLTNRFTYGQKILVVSHACFGISFLQSWAGVREEKHSHYRFTMENTAVSKLKLTSDGVHHISFQNDTAHLRGLDPDTDFNR